MTTDGVVKPACFRRMIVESQRNVDSWNALRDLPGYVAERGANTAEQRLFKPNVLKSITLRRHIVATSRGQT